MAQHIDVTPEMLSECSKRYKEYSKQLEQMLSEMKYDREKLYPSFTGGNNEKERFVEMLDSLSYCQQEIMSYSECLKSVAKSFMVPDSCASVQHFK